MAPLTFEEFAEFIREFRGISPKTPITPETTFEDDLGVTGDDGNDLLEKTETRFGVTLTSEEHGVRQTFGLQSNEYLFHSEGFSLGLLRFALRLFGKRDERVVRQFTVGELYEAVRRSIDSEGRMPDKPA